MDMKTTSASVTRANPPPEVERHPFRLGRVFAFHDYLH